MALEKKGFNGFGVIGRDAFRNEVDKNGAESIGHGNDAGDRATIAYLLQNEQPYGRWKGHEVALDTEGNIIVDGHKIPFTGHRNPEEIPWEKHGVGLVVEGTGAFRTAEASGRHRIGKKPPKVLLTAPPK